MDVLLAECSSHLPEKPGRAREELVEGGGGPTPSSSSPGRQGLSSRRRAPRGHLLRSVTEKGEFPTPPTTGRPSGMRVTGERRQPTEPGRAGTPQRRATTAGRKAAQVGAERQRQMRTLQPLTACGYFTNRPRRRAAPARGLRRDRRCSDLLCRPTRTEPSGARGVPAGASRRSRRLCSLSVCGRTSPGFPGQPGRRRLSLGRRCRLAERRALGAGPARGGERPTMDRDGPDAARREAEREHGRYLDRRAVAQEQLAQIKEHKHQADLAKLEDKREGEQIQRLNRLYQLEIQRGKEKEQEEKVERQRLHHAYIKGKEMMADLTREKDAETNRLMQKHKDKAFAQLTAQMNEACKIEDDRLARGAAEVEYEYQMKNKEKEAKKKATIESIAEHRATVMKMKVEKEREEKAEDEKDRNQWMAADRIYLEMEEAKKQRQRDANMEVQKIQIQQMAEKRAKKQQEKQADLDYDAQREAAFCKDRAFQQ
ncbi:PREDICTED: coiled-coil domain-containing protein 173-like [Haliaeetus leucocephalus]|uniref:coiled-coil domain-containing protein 173-like n=1 Tax=Haliaeetus leucocephalus TaxID=52644 RepID=UPI00053CC534|nr:PREDICTED: coiled-coil domain-containing protein 173-like [Haliaeetus leucocephalus]